jgi:transcriptional regulator of acetoin/glycerol metabolism
MPRPKFAPNDEQRRAIEEIRKAARERERQQARIDEPLETAIADAMAKKVPIATIAKAAGWSRETIYRRLRRDS